MKNKINGIIGMVFCLAVSASAMVIHNYCTDKDESIKTESGIFDEDYLFLGHELNFSGQAEDLVFLGKRLTFEGKTKLGLIALCEKLIYSGSSGNGIIAGGMDVVVNGSIASNSYIGCKSFTLSDKAIVAGNLFVGAADLAIDGKINGDLYAAAGKIVINNEIRGNVNVYSGRILFGEKGKILGNLVYSSKEKMNDRDAAKIVGTVTFKENHKMDKNWNSFVKFIRSIKYILSIALFISCVVVGCLLLFFPVFKKLDAKQSERTFWNTALWGLIPMLMYPAVIVLCFLLILTIPFAIVLILAFFPLLYITYTIGTTFIGKYLVSKFKWNVEKRHYQFMIGALAGLLISIIPFVNFLYMMFVIAIGWGTYISFLFNKDLTVAERERSGV